MNGTIELPAWEWFVSIAIYFAVLVLFSMRAYAGRKLLANARKRADNLEQRLSEALTTQGKTNGRLLTAVSDLDRLSGSYNSVLDKMARQKTIISRLHKLYHTQHAIIQELKTRQAHPMSLSITCYKRDPNMDIRVQESKVREQLSIDLQKAGLITFTSSEFQRKEMKYPELKVIGTIHVAKIGQNEKRV